MEKSLKITIAIIVIIVLAWLGAKFLFVPQNIEPINSPEGVILFYGADCPHCQAVEKFISDNNIAEKVQFSYLEIPFNGKTNSELQANAQILLQKAQACNLNISNGVGIPFLYDGENCIVGEEPVIEFFNNKINDE